MYTHDEHTNRDIPETRSMTCNNTDLHRPVEDVEEVAHFDSETLLKLALLARENPIAASVFLTLLAKIGEDYALIVSFQTLAKVCGLSVAEIERAMTDLECQDWIGRAITGSSPAPSVAYIIMSRVTLSGKSDSDIKHFQARVLISGEDNENMRAAV
jgi:hypothetical protein